MKGVPALQGQISLQARSRLVGLKFSHVHVNAVGWAGPPSRAK